MQKIFILLPVHNRKDITRSFVDCLKIQTFKDYQLVLIDDGSTDGTEAVVRERIPTATVLRGSGNWWWAGSLQRGLDWLNAQDPDDEALVLMINDDVRFAPDYLERAVRVMANRKGTLVLSRFVDPETHDISETGVHADFRRHTYTIAERADRVNCLSTRGLFVHWGDVRKIGGFHPWLLPHYGSDYEYTIRAHRKGFKCETSAELLIEPDHESTGYHVIRETSLRGLMRQLCSKKSSNNPVYWSSFIVLASDPRWVIPNLLRTWVSAAKSILRVLNSSLARDYTQ